MSFQIEFEKKHIFESLKSGISVNVVLYNGNRERLSAAKIDTGSEVCLFARSIADFLEIETEKGFRQNFSTLSGGIVAYAHQLEIETLDIRFQSYIYFAESYEIKRNLLGRQGFLQLVKFGLDDYKSELYLSPNHE